MATYGHDPGEFMIPNRNRRETIKNTMGTQNMAKMGDSEEEQWTGEAGSEAADCKLPKATASDSFSSSRGSETQLCLPHIRGDVSAEVIPEWVGRQS